MNDPRIDTIENELRVLRQMIDNLHHVRYLGVGDATPDADGKIKATQSIETAQKFISTLAVGTTPMQITSTTVVTNLNVDQLDGNHASAFPAIADGGWYPDSDTWVYVSATSFKIEGKDVSARFPVGTRIKLTQTTAKYFAVTACAFSTDTTVTVAGGSDFTVANAAITSPYYGYMASPQGYPNWFYYTVTWGGTGGTPDISNGTLYGRFAVVGRTLHWNITMVWGAATTANSATAWTFTLPVTSADKNVNYPGYGTLRDSGTANYEPRPLVSKNSASLSTIYTGADGTNVSSLAHNVPITWASGDSMNLGGHYEI